MSVNVSLIFTFNVWQISIKSKFQECGWRIQYYVNKIRMEPPTPSVSTSCGGLIVSMPHSKHSVEGGPSSLLSDRLLK